MTDHPRYRIQWFSKISARWVNDEDQDGFIIFDDRAKAERYARRGRRVGGMGEFRILVIE